MPKQKVVPKGLLIIGFGGHARAVADVALASGVGKLIFLDANARDGEAFLGFPVLREFTDHLPDGWAVFAASGRADYRQTSIDQWMSQAPIATLIAPTATIGVGSEIGQGSFIGHHAHVGPMAKIGSGCIINTGAVVEHECVIGDFAHISVNAVVAGRSRVGSNSMIGAGAVVIDGVTVGSGLIVGAGATVCKNIEIPGTYVGTPARLLNR